MRIRRCQWSIVTIIAAIALVANMWLLRPPSCPIHTTPAPSDSPTCKPCMETVLNTTLDDDPISRLDLRLGRWDGRRAYRHFDYAAVGVLYPEISVSHRVCLATQSSIERLHELLRIAVHWSGPISVAVFVAGDELRLLRAFATWLFTCQPEIYARIALHMTMPAERPGIHDAMPDWARDCESKPLPPGEGSADTVAWTTSHPYPQNHLRNLARKNCHTPYIFLVDVDIVPSKGMAEALDQFLANTPKCPLCAYVVPTYELDWNVTNFPVNKSELVKLSISKLAIPFHKKVFIYNQNASNFSRTFRMSQFEMFTPLTLALKGISLPQSTTYGRWIGDGSRWEASAGNESLETHVSHNVTNYELLYEPFYIAPDTVPEHDERFLGYGFTRNTQVYEMFLIGYQFKVLSPIFTIHWGFQKFGDRPPWRMKQVYEMFLIGYQFKVLSPIFTIHWGLQNLNNRPLWRAEQSQNNWKHFQTFKRELFAKYQKDPLHLLPGQASRGRAMTAGLVLMTIVVNFF